MDPVEKAIGVGHARQRPRELPMVENEAEPVPMGQAEKIAYVNVKLTISPYYHETLGSIIAPTILVRIAF